MAAGVALGAIEHNFNPIAMAKGAIAGSVTNAMSNAVGRLKGGLSPGVRNALGEILAQSPQETARQLRLARSAQRQVQLSKSNYATRGLARTAVRGAALAAGAGVANALQGVSH